MTPQELRRRLGRFPRLPLAQTPTPLTILPHLSEELGRPVYIKRDDELGLGLGGNKTRPLAYLLAEAQRARARKVATYGGLQSNHVRISAAVANKLGMEPHIFYFEKRPSHLTGNLLINELLGARMHFIPFGGGTAGSLSLETTIRLVRFLSRLRLGAHYFIPGGGHSWLGSLGYVEAAAEIHEQAVARNLGKARLITAAGTGGTLAGLWAGLTLLDSPIRPLGIDVGKLWKAFPASIAGLATKISERLGEPRSFSLGNVPLIETRYVGARYGVPSQAGDAALRHLALTEGMLLDPIYTSKAFAGLLDLAGQGELGQEEPLIFLHTGGLPALFARSPARYRLNT